jgi:hypothetical protein
MRNQEWRFRVGLSITISLLGLTTETSNLKKSIKNFLLIEEFNKLNQMNDEHE